MSYIAGDSGLRPGGRRVGRGVLCAAGVLLALLTVLAVVLLGAARSDEAAPGTDGPASITALTWVRVGDQPVPLSPTHGPRIIHDGLAAGFSHDELGAAVAAINISTRLTRSAEPSVYQDTARHQCVGDVDAALAAIAVQTSTADPGAVAASEFFYRITAGDSRADTVVVTVVARSIQATNQGGFVAFERTLHWVGHDWRMQVPPAPPYLTSTVENYISLGAISG